MSPCTDNYGYGQTEEERICPPALCAVFTVLEQGGILSGVLSEVDWDEAGVTRPDVEEWWADHKREDQERRAREDRRLRRAHVRARALNKLTAEERAALKGDWDE